MMRSWKQSLKKKKRPPSPKRSAGSPPPVVPKTPQRKKLFDGFVSSPSTGSSVATPLSRTSSPAPSQVSNALSQYSGIILDFCHLSATFLSKRFGEFVADLNRLGIRHSRLPVHDALHASTVILASPRQMQLLVCALGGRVRQCVG